MKLSSVFALIVVLAAASAPAQSNTFSFTNVVNLGIPDANPNGLSSSIQISGLFGSVSNVSVYLNISGGWNGDLYGYLSGDNGGFAVLLNRSGKSASDPTGYGDPGFNVLLDDQAPTDIHLYGGNGSQTLTGLWQPDGRGVNPQLTLDTDPRPSLLGSFNGLDPNGTWTLFLADMAAGYNSTLIEWGITVQTVPEPSAGAIAMFGLVVWGAAFRWRGRKRGGN